jgi:4-carboxymuconolactone decarboxylase
MSDEKTRWEKGLEVVNEVYGPGSSEMMTGLEDSPFVSETVRHVFADIWARPALSIRDKRLLVIGATTMLGRADLITVQVGGALANGELTDEQLDDIPLMMLFYAGAGNTTALYQGINQARAKAKEKKPS